MEIKMDWQNCFKRFLEIILHILNFIFFLTGATFIVLGAFLHINMVVGSPSVFMIVTGVLLVLVSTFGSYGIAFEMSCMMHAFGSFVLAIVLVEIGLGVTVYLKQDKVKDTLLMSLTEGMMKYEPENKEFDKFVTTWDNLQRGYDCCGIENYFDWKNGSQYLKGTDVPDSCCEIYEKECGKDILLQENITSIHSEGCILKLYSDIEDNAVLVMGIGGTLVLFQVLTSISAFVLGHNIGKTDSFTCFVFL